ncbi:MAG: hypothetical protein JWM09_1337 [Francisellaceae bacterium]|nr:hypothetical protein [Francisellaceae bacterium]
MNKHLQERLCGAFIVLGLMIVFVPKLLNGPSLIMHEETGIKQGASQIDTGYKESTHAQMEFKICQIG